MALNTGYPQAAARQRLRRAGGRLWVTLLSDKFQRLQNTEKSDKNNPVQDQKTSLSTGLIRPRISGSDGRKLPGGNDHRARPSKGREKRSLPMRQWQEVQEMLRRCDSAALTTASRADMEILLAATALTVVTAILAGKEARRKGRSRIYWLSLGMLVPIIPLLLVWMLPKVAAKSATRP